MIQKLVFEYVDFSIEELEIRNQGIQYGNPYQRICLYERMGAKKYQILNTRLEPENANYKFAVVVEKRANAWSIPSFKST